MLENKKAYIQTREIQQDSGHRIMTKKIILPYLTDDELLCRYKRISPIVLYKEYYYLLKKLSLEFIRSHSYISDLDKMPKKQIDIARAQVLDEFVCYHSYGTFATFKPSVAEILQQFPDNLLNKANAFVMTEKPSQVKGEEDTSEIMDAGCHTSKVRALRLF